MSVQELMLCRVERLQDDAVIRVGALGTEVDRESFEEYCSQGVPPGFFRVIDSAIIFVGGGV